MPTLRSRGLMAVTFSLCLLAAAGGQARTLLDSQPTMQPANAGNIVHREFDATLAPGEQLVVLIRASGDCTVTIDGYALGSTSKSAAPTYARFRVPAADVHAGKNTIDLTAKDDSAIASPPTCDVIVKTLPAAVAEPPVSAVARKVLEQFRHTSYLDAGEPIPDGYIDGGHGMKLDPDDHATSGREILVVDRGHDAELQKDIAFAKTLQALEPIERAHQLSLYVDKLCTPLGGRTALGPTVDELQGEFKDQEIFIGDFVDQCHAGVCRHRSLLFKLLADEAGLKTALVRGNYFHAGKGDAHAWNELLLPDGRRFLVDATLHPRDNFPEITSPAVTIRSVAQHYVRLDNSPYYQSAQ